MIDKIVTGVHLKRLDNIIQWQERDVFNKESVSQHSFKVSVFTRVLLEDIFGTNSRYDILKFKLDCLTHALFHDWDEAIFLRDVSHSTKYNKFNGEEVRAAIDHYVAHEFVEEFVPEDGENDSYKMLNEAVVEPNKTVKKVVKVADWLALLYFCRRELALGNENFNLTYDYCKQGLLKAATDAIYAVSEIWIEVDTDKRSKFLGNIQKIIASEIHGNKDF